MEPVDGSRTQVRYERNGEILVLRLEGPLTHLCANEARSEIRAILEREASMRLAVDLGGVTRLDSTGIGVFFTLIRERPPSARVRFFGLDETVKRLFRITHLDHWLFVDADEAVCISHLASEESGAPKQST
jgi:anti-anti-sigma factor